MPRSRLSALAVFALAACDPTAPDPADAGGLDAAAGDVGSGDAGVGPDADPPLDATAGDGAPALPEGRAWGSVGVALPPGAEEVPAETLLGAAADPETFALVTPAELTTASTREDELHREARALVSARLGGDPRFAHWLEDDSGPLPAGLTRLPSGGALYTSTVTGEGHVLDGRRGALVSLARSLVLTSARANLERRYAALHAPLPADARADLPDPAALGALDDAALAARVRDLALRAAQALPRQVLSFAAADEFDLGCPAKGDGVAPSLAQSPDNPGWQLRPFETGIRSQGRRGTCVAHAVVAGLEAAVRRKHGLETDLSEQELYADAKGRWFPDPADFFDGLPLGNVLEELVDRSFRVDAERRWPYNSSPNRVANLALRRFTDSCLGYSSPFCSDTNHQLRRLCSEVAGLVYCGEYKPPKLDTIQAGNARVVESVSLWDPLAPEDSIAAIRAHLDAGHPVAIGAALGPSFLAGLDRTGVDRGFVRNAEDPANIAGYHAMLAVGYLPRALLPEAYRGYEAWEGRGFLVLKNSWGCAGDAGHVYVSERWAAESIHTAVALTEVGTNVTAPQVTVATARANLTSAGSVRLTVKSNRAVVKLSLYEGLGAETPIFTRDVATPADGTESTFDRVFTAADQGLHLYVVRAEDVFGNVVTSNIVGIMVSIDTAAPKVTLSASALVVPAGGTVELSAAVADDPSGIARVWFLHGLSLLDEDETAPYASAYRFAANEIGMHGFAAMAFDGAQNQQASKIVWIEVVPDTSPPTVSLTASASTLVAPGVLTLRAVAADDVGVVRVEFSLDGAVVASDASARDGFSDTLTLDPGDVGTRVFSARAYDAAGNSADSAEVHVEVVSARYVRPDGVDAGNSTCAAAAPCRTIAHAAAQVGPGGTVALLDGTYDTATQGTANILIPDGVTLRAANDRGAVVKCVIELTGSATVAGVRIDRTGPNAAGGGAGIRASAGEVIIESVDFRGSYSSPGLSARGAARVWVRPGAVADYTAATVALGSASGPAPFLRVSEEARVVVAGGVFGGPGLGAVPTTPNGGAGAALLVEDRGALELRGVTLVFNTVGVAVLDSGVLTMFGGELRAGAAGNHSAAIHLENDAAPILPWANLSSVTITGQVGAQRLRAGIRTFGAGTRAGVSLLGSTIEGCVTGVSAGAGTELHLNAGNFELRDNLASGLRCEGACDLTLANGEITANAAGGAFSPFGGLHVGATTAVHRVYLRGVRVTGNVGAAVNGDTNRADNSGVVLKGAAGSQFDLGTASSPGQNVFTGNVTGPNASNLYVAADPSVTVTAIGNTFEANVQGADGGGRYSGDVLVTSGAGANYRVASGRLRLASP